MIAFHLTETKNLLSIKIKGLLPSLIILEHHLKNFNARGLIGNKILYAWNDSLKNDKFAKDMIYCKQWIDKRNKLNIDDYSKAERISFYEESYVLLKINFSEILNCLFDNDSYIHTQYSIDKHDSCFGMDKRFEHDDKRLCLFKNRIDFKYIEPVDFYYSETDKANRLIIKKEKL